MTKIIKFTPTYASKSPGSVKENPSPEKVHKFMLNIDNGEDDEDDDDDLHVHMTFLNLDEVRTAIIGDYAAIEPLIEELHGKVQRRKHIYDDSRKDRGPGIVLSVTQVVELLQMMIEDGWTDLNPDVHIIAEARYKALQEKMGASK
ncbi:MAG: hypothetical protein IKX61_01385 [Prevotella sp.]|nr:hypothetical protein [Prevotella sp.]